MNTGSQRISLSRILAVNWYGFRQIIDIADNTVLAGAFGTGKSALLDLVQYAALGGDHWKPNRAAAGRGRGRTLVSYCLCDSNTERDGQPHYTRPSGVTLAALEFTWPEGEEPRRETWGARVEFSSPTSEPKITWFFVPDRLEWGVLAPDGKEMLGEEAFRTLVRRDFGGAVFGRAMDYLDEMATPRHLHFDRGQMNKTMPKAIAFEPEENFEKFIREFLLEPNPVDVREVRQSLGAHRDMQSRLAKLRDEAGFLDRISEKHQACAAAALEAALHGRARHALVHAEAAENLAARQADRDLLEKNHAGEQATLGQKSADLAKVSKLVQEVRLEASRDPDYLKLDALDRQKSEMEANLHDLREASRSVNQRLAGRADDWLRWLRHAGSLSLEGLAPFGERDEAIPAALREGAGPAAFEAMQDSAARFNEIFNQTGPLLQPRVEELKAAERKLEDLNRELEAIGRKETPGAFPVLAAIRQRLAAEGRRPPEQLCRLVEVKPDEERWWLALEMVLGSDRFAILVAEDDYPAALDALKRAAPGRERESLVNPKEARALGGEPWAESLAAKLEAAHATTRAFITHLLGDIACVETPEELERCVSARAITREGLFRQTPTRRRLREDGERPYTLGREGLERMKRERFREQAQNRARRDALDRLVRDVRGWLDWGRQAGLGDPRLPDRASEVSRLPELEREFARAVETIQLIATPERAARLARLKELEESRSKLDREAGLLQERVHQFAQAETEAEERIRAGRAELEKASVKLAENRLRMPAGLTDEEIAAFLAPLLAEDRPWPEQIDRARDQEAAQSARATGLRHERNNLRRGLADSRDEANARRHPEYHFDFDPEEEGNDRWDGRLRLLRTQELERHEALAAEKKREWEERLKSQVLDKLNERLQEAKLATRQVNQYLDRVVGKYRYQISYRRDQAMGAIWQLLDTGFEATDDLVRGVKTEEIERAREELMRAVAAADQPQPDERSLRLLDYRQYHRYDLVMEPAGQPGGAKISLTRSISKMSGGENQAPFFICMLAAFHRVYDVGSQRFRQNPGLVVMDEAFSKLSGDGIEDCLELARNFHLQLLMAVPIDRLGAMHTHADAVILCQKFEQRASDGYVSRIDNVPVRLTPEQTREAIE
jgi:uncharacterized protein YPO0396